MGKPDRVRGSDMASITDVVELARIVSSIASTTTDPETAAQLMELADRLLTEAGLPPAPGDGPLPPTQH